MYHINVPDTTDTSKVAGTGQRRPSRFMGLFSWAWMDATEAAGFGNSGLGDGRRAYRTAAVSAYRRHAARLCVHARWRKRPKACVHAGVTGGGALK